TLAGAGVTLADSGEVFESAVETASDEEEISAAHSVLIGVCNSTGDCGGAICGSGVGGGGVTVERADSSEGTSTPARKLAAQLCWPAVSTIAPKRRSGERARSSKAFGRPEKSSNAPSTWSSLTIGMTATEAIPNSRQL